MRGKRRDVLQRVSHSKIYGGVVNGCVHPPTTSCSPWNRYTLTFILSAKVSGLQCIMSKRVCKRLRSELGLQQVDIDIRVKRIDVWIHPASVQSGGNAFYIAPCDWTNKHGCNRAAVLNHFDVRGTFVRPAHFHYVWEKRLAMEVIRGQINTPLVHISAFASKMAYLDKYLVKVCLEWRPSQPDPSLANKGLLATRRFEHSPLSDCVMYNAKM